MGQRKTIAVSVYIDKAATFESGKLNFMVNRYCAPVARCSVTNFIHISYVISTRFYSVDGTRLIFHGTYLT